MAKLKTTVTPKGVLSWPYIGKPDTRYNPEGVYKTSLIVPAEAAEPLMTMCKEAFTTEYGATKMAKANMPFSPELDDQGQETGNVVFKFKSKRAPKLYDAKGKVINKVLQVSSGTVAKVATAINPYMTGINVGVSLYLNDVQIIELVEYGAGAKFEAEDGYEAEDNGSTDDGKDSPDF
jgi:hypothetical protein